MFNSFGHDSTHFYCMQDIQMWTPIAVPDLVRELVQFILATYTALEENLPFWTVRMYRIRWAMLTTAPILMMSEWDVHVRTYNDYVVEDNNI